MTTTNQLIIYDTEYTAWEGSMERGWSGPGEFRELLQLGAVKVLLEKDSPKIIDKLLIHCIPTINPELSAYITDLTGITQWDINTKGVPFVKFASIFRCFAVNGRLPMFSWGRTDDAVLMENYQLNGMAWPHFEGGFHDMRKIFIAHDVDATAYYSGEISQRFGIIPDGRIHNAMHDALSIFEAFGALFQSKPLPDMSSLKQVCSG